MKHSRLILAAVLAALILSTAGCMKIWSVDFRNVNDIDDWYNSDPGSEQLIGGTGLVLDGATIGTPVAFGADFEVTLVFYLGVDASSRASLTAFIGDSSTWRPMNFFLLKLGQMGDPGSEQLQITDAGPILNTNIANNNSADIPYLDRNGLNTLVINKTGNVIQMYLNDELLQEFALLYCNAAHYRVNLTVDCDGDSSFIIKSIKVKYSGSLL